MLSDAMLERLRSDVAKLREYEAIPKDEFPGNKTIAELNMTSYLGQYVPALLDEIERVHVPVEVVAITGRSVRLQVAGDAAMWVDVGDTLQVPARLQLTS